MRTTGFLVRAVVATAMATCALAQFTQRSGISGLVTDTSGASIPNVPITLNDVDRNQVYRTSSNDRGLYTFSNLTAGRYRVTAEMTGFKKAVSDTVTLSAGDNGIRIDLGLEVGAVSESIEVTSGGAALLQTEHTSVGQLIDRAQIESLPVWGHNITSLEVLSPNVSIYSKANVGGTTAVGAHHAAGGVFVVSGGGGDTGYYMNGMNINDTFEEWISYSPSPEAIAEQKVDAVNFSATSGHDINVVNIQTRNGTNQFHAAGFDYFQNSALNAWNPYTKSTVPAGTKKTLLQRNRAGGNLGGPVVIPKIFNGRDKAFFFVNYEGSLENNGGGTSTARVPTAAERQGNYGAYLSRFPGDPNYILYDPLSTTFLPNGNSVRTPFPGNVISAAEVNPGARALLDLFPQPNGYVNPINAKDLTNYQYFSSRGNYNYRIDSRFDYRLTTNDSVYVSIGRSHGYDHASGGVFPDLVGKTDDKSYVITVNYARVFTPHLTNEFIFGTSKASRDSVDAASQSYMQNPDLLRNKYFKNLGTPNNFGFYGLMINGYPTNGFPEVAIYRNPTQQFSDGANWLKGSHAFKAGMQYIKQGRGTLNYQRSLTFAQTYTRSGSSTGSLGGDPMADFQVGIPTSMKQQFAFVDNAPPWRDFRVALWGFYGEDKWQLTPKLTLNLGLRWDIPIPTWSQNSFGLAVFDNSYPGGQLSIPGIDPKRPLHDIPAPKRDFAPRLGLAYRPGRDFVVRASYGIFYQAGTIEMFSNQGSTVNVAGDGGEVFDNTRYGLPNDQPYFTFNSIFPAEAPIPLGTYPVSTGKGTGYFTAPTGTVLYRDKQSNATPYYQRWTLDLQKSIGTNTIVSLTYLGGHGTKLSSYPDYNIPAYRTGYTSTAAFNNARPLGGNRFTSLRLLRHDYSSKYEAGTVKIQRNMSHGLQFVAHYTFSKTVTDLGTWGMTDWLTGLFVFPSSFDWNRKLGHGEAVYSHPHRFVMALTYQSTWGRTLPALPKAILSGWNFSTITTFESGDALSVTNGQTSARDMEPNLPNLTGAPNISGGDRSPYHYFNTAAFSAPPQDVKGNAGVGIVRGPGTNNWNSTLSKSFKPTERVKVDLRAELYNAFNHTQWRSINTTFSSNQGNTFGWVTGAREPRVVELGLRIGF